MPNITVDGPAIRDLDRKRALVRSLTAAAVEAFSLPAEAIVVILKENPPENVGIGGELLVDRKPHR